MKALACELPARLGLPVSRFSRAELRRHVVTAGIVAAISGVTIWRWLHADALRPWSRRSWIFPRDPQFAQKAGPVLDLYHRRWHGRPLRPDEFVLCAELRRHVVTAGIVAAISGVTIWRWLHADALRPWSRRSWIFPRDPQFAQKAGPVLDLYHRRWHGRPLRPDEFVLCADEKTQIPIRTRCHPLVPPAPGRALRVEHEYRRHGVCAYLAAWDVQRARLFGRVVQKISIPAFDSLVADVMAHAPYRSARRVFWIVDGGTIHRGERAAARLRARFPNLVLVHLPTHASWLNQIEIYFSILQRKALTPAEFGTQAAVAARILGFQSHYEQVAKPFAWTFTRRDLGRLMERWRLADPASFKAAA